MPFTDLDGGPLDGVPLLYRGGRLFQLTRGFRWTHPSDGWEFEVPAHDPRRPATEKSNATDLASVPPLLWGLVASYGRQTLPAILHDALLDEVDRLPLPERHPMRRRADDAFRIALEEAGVTWLRALTMWAAVALQREWLLRRTLAVLLIAQLVLSAVVLVGSVAAVLSGAPVWLLALVGVPALLAAAWGRDATLALAASYLGAIYLPLLAAAAIASAVEYVVAVLAWLAIGRRGAPPAPGPTIRGERRPVRRP